LDIAIKRSYAETTDLSLPPEVIARVKRIAKKQGVSYQTLLQRSVEERIEKEQALP
jgi:predicted DNA binding CopG/RHH family protein